MAKEPRSKASRMESLQTPFNVRLYGRVIQGIEVNREYLNGRIGERATLRALRVRFRPSEEATSGLGESPSQEYEQDSPPSAELSVATPSAARLANIYGYARGNARTILLRPLTFLVDDEGQNASGWDNQFSEDDGFRLWEVEPQEATYRFNVRAGSFDELLLAGEVSEEPVAGAAEPEGGTMIRGADNRLYMIPLALEPFEVRDPQEISELQLQAPSGREIKVDSVRSLSGRSTLVARSTLQVRSTLTLRSTLAARR